MSNNPAYPDADPTAPGGMSRKQLAAELTTKHGWSTTQVKQKFGNISSWARMIDEVCTERRNRELEQREDFDPVEQEVVSEASDTEPDEVDLLLAELEEASDEAASLLEQADDDGVVTIPTPLFIGMPNTRDYIFDGHRGAGPSAAERWMACTASLSAVRAFLETLTPNQQSAFAEANTAARQGTTAHAAAEVEARVILGTVAPEEAENTLLELAVEPPVADEAYDEEMAEYIAEYLDLVKSYVDEGREVLIEERVEACIPLLTATDGEPDDYTITGALDLGVMPTEEHPVLVVGDLKYGEGIDVDVERNPQIRIYGIGLLARIVAIYGGIPDWLTDIEYIIVQPRLGGIKTWTEKIDDLLDWQDNVLSKALTEALAGPRGGAAFVPGEVQCQWCPVRGSCPALIEKRTGDAADLFDVIVEAEYNDGPGAFPETTALSNERLGALYAQVLGLTKIASDMKEELQRRMYRGAQVPGFVLVNYTPRRSWHEGAQDLIASGGSSLPAKVADQLFREPTLVTPAAAEKILGDDYSQIASLIEKPDKRPVIAPEGDRRSLWEGKAPEDMFTDMDGDE